MLASDGNWQTDATRNDECKVVD